MKTLEEQSCQNNPFQKNIFTIAFLPHINFRGLCLL